MYKKNLINCSTLLSPTWHLNWSYIWARKTAVNTNNTQLNVLDVSIIYVCPPYENKRDVIVKWKIPQTTIKYKILRKKYVHQDFSYSLYWFRYVSNSSLNHQIKFKSLKCRGKKSSHDSTSWSYYIVEFWAICQVKFWVFIYLTSNEFFSILSEAMRRITSV